MLLVRKRIATNKSAGLKKRAPQFVMFEMPRHIDQTLSKERS